MKKKVVAAMMSVALVAAVGIGGTLAYLSSTSNDVKNTFTVGKGFDDTDGQALIVDEWLLDGTADDRTQEDQTYENMTPGYVEKKDPTARLKAGSVESYVFLHVTGVNALESIMKSNADGDDVQAYDISGWDTTYWMKVADENGTLLHETKLGLEGDGYYVANTGNTVNLEDTTPEGEYIQLGNPIFQTVTMNPDVAEVTEDLGTEIGEITVKACAVQYSEDQMGSWKDAFDSAKWN